MTQPPFISWLGHGAVNLAPPGLFHDVTGYAFVLDASRRAMQALVDKLLTPATQGRVSYQVPWNSALLSVTDIAQCSSGPEQIGWLPGKEFAIWVPLLERRPHRLLPRAVLWAPYIFINYDIGLVTGREVWGWNKAIGHITVEPQAQPARFACSTTIFSNFGPQTQGSFEELLAITGTRPITTGPADFIEFLSALFGEAGAEMAKALKIEPVIPAIALRQMRDTAEPTRAIYQAIVNSPCRITKMKGAELLDDRFTLSIRSCDSHRIMQDIFGVEPTEPFSQRPIRLAARVKFDFQAEPGETIVAWP
jgi:hypothetical protein